jgi:CheY-like chemotaxis protein
VFEASGGDEALARLAHPDPIHVLVTDIRLVGSMDGWDIADAFRAARPMIGVIYASANAPIEARQVPGSLFFAKPAPMKELVRACHAFCDGEHDRGSLA